MRVVIVGAGVIGYHLARQLSSDGFDVSVVDRDPDLTREIDDRMDVLAVSGNAAAPSVLEQAGVPSADLVVAVTDQDTTNIVVSLVARRLGAGRCIIRVRNSEFSRPDSMLRREDIGADLLLNPVEIAAKLLERIVRNPGSTDVVEFGAGNVFLWGFLIPPGSPLENERLKDLHGLRSEMNALIGAIARPDGTIVIPSGEDTLRAGDRIHVFLPRKVIREFRRRVGPDLRRPEKVVIAGASLLGIELARRLESRVKSVFLVDPDRTRVGQATEELEKTVVLRGDLDDPELAHEYGLDSADAFLALSDEDQSNLMNGLLVKKRSRARVAVLVQQPQYLPVIQRLDFDVVVNPRLLAVSAILTQIHPGSLLQLHRLGESGAEAREYVARKGSPIVGKPLKAVRVPRGVILGATFRHGSFHEIPGGESVIDPEDRVVVLTLPEAATKVDRLFSTRSLLWRG